MAENPTPGSSDILGPEPGDSDILGHETGDTDELGPETGDTDILGHETGDTDELGPETGDTDVLRLPGYLIAAGASSAGRHEHRGSKLSGRDDRRLVVRSPRDSPLRGGRLRTNEAITSDSSALVLVTCDPNSRDANASVVSRSFGRDSCTGPAVVLTVTSRYPFRELGPDVFTRRGPLVAAPAMELGDLGFESGLHQQPRA